VTAAPIPDDPGRPVDGEESISASAERARAELHSEIERVRRGVEQMLDEQDAPLNDDLRGELDTMQEDLRRELDTAQEDIRRYVKTRIKKSQKRTDRRVGRLEDRTSTLEKRLDDLAAERRLAEYRIHSDTEQMLDGLLGEVRTIADRLEGRAP
jgi:chromosome segregation ATPase